MGKLIDISTGRGRVHIEPNVKPTPTERVEDLYTELCRHYEKANDKEVRAASKLLLVALARLREHGGPQWDDTLDAYVRIAKRRPEKLFHMLNGSKPGYQNSN